MSDLTVVVGIGPGLANALAEKGIKTLKKLVSSSEATLVDVRGISPAKAAAIVKSAKEILAAPAEAKAPAKAPAKIVVKAPAKAAEEAKKPKKEKKKKKGKKDKKKKKKKKGKKSKK